MGNILDYIDWRGDLTFDREPFHEVDALVLSTISYVEFDKIVSDEIQEQIVLIDAFEMLKGHMDDPKYRNLGLVIPEEVFVLFEKMANSRRYANLRMSGYINQVDERGEGQFAALTLQNDENDIYVVFRGTDDTIVGWKEDFNMAYLDVIPSQEKALLYLKAVASNLRGKIWIMGHSKGGNVSVYSAALCGKRIQKRIMGVYNWDGPGLKAEFLALDVYQIINEKVHWYIPYESMIGTLLCHGTNEHIIGSTKRGIMQHDMFSWEVMGKHMMEKESLSREAMLAHLAIDEVMAKMTNEQRKQFVTIIFDALAATEAKTLSEISFKHFGTLIDTVKNMDADSRKTLGEMGKLVLKTVRENR